MKRSYDQLKAGRSEEKGLLKWLDNAFDALEENAFCGTQIPKRQMPKRYLKDYGIDNLWKYDLPQGLRLIYSVARDEVTVISIVLEWMDHKDYEKRFNY